MAPTDDTRFRIDDKGVEVSDDCELCGETHPVTRLHGIAIIACPSVPPDALFEPSALHMRRARARSQTLHHGRWILDGHTPRPARTLMEWAHFYEDFSKRIVKHDEVGNILVSTVFLGLDHNYFGKGPPLLFETMLLSKTTSTGNYQERYATWDEAEKGHARALAEALALQAGKGG